MLLRTTRTWIGSTIALVAAAALVVGCQNDEPDGPGGIVDPSDSADASVRGYATDRIGSSSRTYSGHIFGEVSVEISTDGSTWYMLGPATEFDARLVDDSRAEMTPAASVDAGTYRHVRINFEGVEAVLEEGSTVDGHTLQSDVHLRLGDTGNGVTSKEVEAYQLQSGDSAHIILDVNSGAWVRAGTLEAREIPKKEFEEKVSIEIVGGS